jgi:hypothetical protein
MITLTALASAVAGEPIRGSWWGHAKGKLIYSIATALEDDPNVLACKLAEGKATFVDRSLWPALFRVVTDPRWRRVRKEELPSTARRVVSRAERAPVRLAKKTLSARDKGLLEESALLLVSSEHTEGGAHATVLRSFRTWADARTRRDAQRLTLAEAFAELASSGLSLD